MSVIDNNIKHLLHTIETLEQRYQRPPGAVQLLAVSKTKPAADIELAYAAGQRQFGESYIQEAVDKISEIGYNDICWHFIGPVQSNKTRLIAENFSWVHSVDRLKIAHRLSEQRPPDLPPLNICLQVNISAEASKSGVSPDEVAALAADISTLPNLALRGLMTIPARTDGLEQQRKPFRALRELLEQLQQQFPGLDTLSIGMSNDIEAAIAEGSTMVRIGTDIFGARAYP